MARAKQTEKTVKVKFIRPHTHAGKQYKPGDTEELPEKAAAFCVRAKSAEKV